jgi:hypothetical protein
MSTWNVKYPPSQRDITLCLASIWCWIAAYISLIAWGMFLRDSVDELTRQSIGTHLSILNLILNLWVIRETAPMIWSFVKNLHYDIMIAPREYEAEVARRHEEWRQSMRQPPKHRRTKMKPIGEPINLKQWVGSRYVRGGGYVYVLRDIEISGYYKIGKTSQPYDRMKAFGVRLPFAAELIHVIDCHNAHVVEAHLHKHFAAKRRQGEWFALEPSDVEWLKLFHRVDRDTWQ